MNDVEKIAYLREALRKCSECFSEIRSDWSDPRSDCREGWEIIQDALDKTVITADDNEGSAGITPRSTILSEANRT